MLPPWNYGGATRKKALTHLMTRSKGSSSPPPRTTKISFSKLWNGVFDSKTICRQSDDTRLRLRREANQDLALTRITKFRPAEPITLAGTRAAFALIVAVSVAGAATLSTAQAVPVPKPAPKSRDSTQLSASERQKRSVPSTGTATPPEPVIPDPRRNVPTNIFASFDANQKA